MPPRNSDDEPARWRMIEATNGYDVDNSWFREPVSLRVPSRRRGGRLAHALTRPLSALSGGQRFRRRPVDPAGAWVRTSE